MTKLLAFVCVYICMCVGERALGKIFVRVIMCVRSFFTEFVETSALRTSFQDLFLFLVWLLLQGWVWLSLASSLLTLPAELGKFPTIGSENCTSN